ncbi:hypothetical protein FH972_026880 [Carpinus fangiana]|uniref:Uncharacterized protein n=1 Tax=Carpinus fangiana TaxID=176857 RepID=A0A5N6L5P1_9ROSI|nr:hypothetical protein FH972_026880 [Carpinus fangiana]
MSGAGPWPMFWRNPVRYCRWAAHEKPFIFYSLVIGLAGPLFAIVKFPIDRHFGVKPPPEIPMTYPKRDTFTPHLAFGAEAMVGKRDVDLDLGQYDLRVVVNNSGNVAKGRLSRMVYCQVGGRCAGSPLKHGWEGNRRCGLSDDETHQTSEHASRPHTFIYDLPPPATSAICSSPCNPPFHPRWQAFILLDCNPTSFAINISHSSSPKLTCTFVLLPEAATSHNKPQLHLFLLPASLFAFNNSHPSSPKLACTLNKHTKMSTSPPPSGYNYPSPPGSPDNSYPVLPYYLTPNEGDNGFFPELPDLPDMPMFMLEDDALLDPGVRYDLNLPRLDSPAPATFAPASGALDSEQSDNDEPDNPPAFQEHVAGETELEQAVRYAQFCDEAWEVALNDKQQAIDTLETFRNQYHVLSQNHDSLQARVDSLEQAAGVDLVVANRALEAQNKQLKDEVRQFVFAAADRVTGATTSEGAAEQLADLTAANKRRGQQITTLESRLKESEKANSDLSTRLEQVVAQFGQGTPSNPTLAQAQASIQVLNNKCESFERIMNDYKDGWTQSDTRVKTLTVVNKHFEQEVKAARTELATAKAELATTNAKLDQTVYELAQTFTGDPSTADELATAKGQLAATKAQLAAQYTAASNELAAKADELTAKSDELTAKSDELATTSAELAATKAELATQFTAASTEIAAKADELATTNAELAATKADLATQYTAASTEIAAKADELTAARTELATIKAELTARFTAATAELATKADELAATNAELISHKSELAAQLTAATTELAAKTDKLTATNADLISTKAELDSKKSEIAANNTELDEAREGIARVEEERFAYQQVVIDRDALQKALHNSEATKAKAEASLEHVAQQYSNERASLASVIRPEHPIASDHSVHQHAQDLIQQLRRTLQEEANAKASLMEEKAQLGAALHDKTVECGTMGVQKAAISVALEEQKALLKGRVSATEMQLALQETMNEATADLATADREMEKVQQENANMKEEMESLRRFKEQHSSTSSGARTHRRTQSSRPASVSLGVVNLEAEIGSSASVSEEEEEGEAAKALSMSALEMQEILPVRPQLAPRNKLVPRSVRRFRLTPPKPLADGPPTQRRPLAISAITTSYEVVPSTYRAPVTSAAGTQTEPEAEKQTALTASPATPQEVKGATAQSLWLSPVLVAVTVAILLLVRLAASRFAFYGEWQAANHAVDWRAVSSHHSPSPSAGVDGSGVYDLHEGVWSVQRQLLDVAGLPWAAFILRSGLADAVGGGIRRAGLS